MKRECMRVSKFLVVSFVSSTIFLCGCSSQKKSAQYEEAVTREIYSHDSKAAKWREYGNTEMANYESELADKAREEYERTEDPVDTLIGNLFENLLNLLFD